MKLTKKSLLTLVTNLFDGALSDTKESVEEVDIRYFQGKTNAYEKIMLLMLGDEAELFETLEQLSYRTFTKNDEELAF